MDKSLITASEQGFKQGQRNLALENARLVSAFIALGFKSFQSFYNIVTSHYPNYSNAHGLSKLDSFWDLNNRDAALNEIITNLLEQLSND